MREKLDQQLRRHTILLVISYTILSILWIIFSDRMVAYLFDPETRVWIQSYKGILFVIVTSLFLLVLLNNKNRSIKKLFRRSLNHLKTFQQTFEKAAVGIAHLSADEEWLRVNTTFCNMMGYSREEIKKLKIADLVHPEDLKEGQENDQKLIDDEIQSYVMKKRYITKQGEVWYARITKSRANQPNGKLDYLIAIIEDISDEHKATQDLKNSLRQKEILIKEIHHRVKNNLGLVSALLEMQYFTTDEAGTKEQLQQAMLRIKCIGLIYESFYQSEQFSYVIFNEYLENFIDHLKIALDFEAQCFTLSTEKVRLDINQAIPLGLLLNELLSVIKFESHREDRLKLVLKKNSAEIKVELHCRCSHTPKLNFSDADSLDSSIIQSLIKQLNAQFQIKNTNTLTLTLSFNMEESSGPAQGISPHILS